VVLEMGFEAGFHAAAAPVNRVTPAPSDDERRLAWLSQQVSPTVRRLLAGGIPAEELRKALGLTDRLGAQDHGNPTE
jgi:hypothetical protein